jgi:hypothetical protein
MTDRASHAPSAPDTAEWIRAIAAGLTAAGLATKVRETNGGLDLTAACQTAGKGAEVILDDEGYAELRWWADLAATPAEVTAVVTRVLAAATPAPVPDEGRP